MRGSAATTAHLPSSRRRVTTALLRPFPVALVAVAVGLVPPFPTALGQELERLVEGPRADWRVLESEHFRVYYPEPAAAWAEQAAGRLEAVRERVAAEVGFAPEQVVDVVVSDPVAAPNGFALPLLGRPRMVLWTRPPGPESVIGHYRDWGELLVVHEETHLVHLLRPSRNPWRRAVSRLLPLGPIARQGPRWISEGYATVIEGRLTGTGRPHGDLRASILRRWAMAGKLPSYGALAGNDSYLGQSMAYLAGSAYLGWLEERTGEGTLRDLWARMTARQPRSFEESFAGVFGDTPPDLWDRFRAELTWRALEVERRVDADGGFVEGERWMDLSWQTGAPALSPDGERLAVVLADHDEPPELAVFATDVDREAVAERAERRREILERDPQDVPAVELASPPHRRLHTLPTIDFAPPSDPRWSPDGGSLLLVRTLPDAEGFLHPDLFRWTPASDRLERLTVAADLTQPDPAPDGGWAVAVQGRHGTTRLVRVELADGEVTPITEASVEVVVDAPRIAPDGERLVYARHAAGRWTLTVRRLADGSEEELPLPAGATVAAPAWGRGTLTGAVIATVGGDGFIDLHLFTPVEGGGWERRRLTRTRGAAFSPEPGDGEVFFLSLEPDGLDLRRLAFGAGGGGDDPSVGSALPELLGETPDDPARRGSTPQEPAGPAGRSAGTEETFATAAIPSGPFAGQPPSRADPADLGDLAPVVRPRPIEPPPPLEPETLPPARPYGLGRQELFFLSGGSTAPSNDGIELGLRGGDLLGRLDWIVTAGLGAAALAEGSALGAVWRGPTPGIPLDVSLHLYSVRERPSRQPEEVPGLGRALDVDRDGAELVATWRRRARPGALRLTGGVYRGRVEPAAAGGPGGSRDELSLFTEAEWRPRWSRGVVSWGLDLAARAESAETGDLGWDRQRGEIGLAVGHDDSSLAVHWTGGRVDGDAPVWQRFQLGGVRSSLLPGSVEAARLLVPALPLGTRSGSELAALRVDLDLDLLPLPIFWARYDLDGAGGPATADGEMSLAGAEWRLELGPVPLVRLPVVELTLGGAYVFDPPFEDEVNGWVALTWRP